MSGKRFEIWVVGSDQREKKHCRSGCESSVFVDLVLKDLPERLQARCENGHGNNYRITPDRGNFEVTEIGPGTLPGAGDENRE